MKATYSISRKRVMRAAWEIKKGRHNGYPSSSRNWSFAKCLRWAWADEKRQVAIENEEYDRRNGLGKWSPENIAKINSTIKTSVCDMSHLADTLNGYYANNMYNGD